MFFESLESRQLFAASVSYTPVDPPPPAIHQVDIPPVVSKGSAPEVNFPAPPSSGGPIEFTPADKVLLDLPAPPKAKPVMPVLPKKPTLVNSDPKLGPEHVLKKSKPSVVRNTLPNSLGNG